MNNVNKEKDWKRIIENKKRRKNKTKFELSIDIY